MNPNYYRNTQFERCTPPTFDDNTYMTVPPLQATSPPPETSLKIRGKRVGARNIETRTYSRAGTDGLGSPPVEPRRRRYIFDSNAYLSQIIFGKGKSPCWKVGTESETWIFLRSGTEVVMWETGGTETKMMTLF